MLWSSLAAYEGAAALSEVWDTTARAFGAEKTLAARSRAGRGLFRYEFGRRAGPVVLLSALMHGIEVIGSIALLDFIRWLYGSTEPLARSIAETARVVVFPIVNPDAFDENMERLARGGRAWRRCNGAGVDLNRNFPKLTDKRSFHPLAGSNRRWSPHYHGPAALSEPESRALAEAARAERPLISLAFHSFGNLVLYPWAYTSTPNPRRPRYEALGRAFRAAQRAPYRVRQSRAFYPVIGDMDDWLDAELGTFAFTVEVGSFGVGPLEPARLTNPFCWMNQRDVGAATTNLTPGLAALVGMALAPAMNAKRPPATDGSVAQSSRERRRPFCRLSEDSPR